MAGVVELTSRFEIAAFVRKPPEALDLTRPVSDSQDVEAVSDGVDERLSLPLVGAIGERLGRPVEVFRRDLNRSEGGRMIQFGVFRLGRNVDRAKYATLASASSRTQNTRTPPCTKPGAFCCAWTRCWWAFCRLIN